MQQYNPSKKTQHHIDQQLVYKPIHNTKLNSQLSSTLLSRFHWIQLLVMRQFNFSKSIFKCGIDIRPKGKL